MDLKEIHDAVKNHPFRLENDDRYWKSYNDLLAKLSHEFFMVLCKIPRLKRASDIVIHDFNGAILNKRIDHIERCIGIIHTFIDTGEIPVAFSYYDGSNRNPFFNPLVKYVYDESVKGNFRLVLTKSEVVNGLNYILDWRKRNTKYTAKQLEYSPYSDYWIEFLTEYKSKEGW